MGRNIYLVIGIIAAILGFGAVARTASSIAQILLMGASPKIAVRSPHQGALCRLVSAILILIGGMAALFAGNAVIAARGPVPD